jgi:hypothetical protein
MASYNGRHRTPSSAQSVTRGELREKQAPPRRRVARPLLAGGLAAVLGVGALGYAATGALGESDAPAYVVSSGVAAQTDELAKAILVDTSYRAAASVSRNERRTAIAAAGVASAKEAEKIAREEAAKQAEIEAEKSRLRKIEAARDSALANARQNPRAAARVLMAERGWTSDAQYNCLVNLWNGESAWRHTAENPSSGAYGIPQSLPANKMAKFGSDYRTNPVTQIRWGLWYIQQSYGNPCNAWSFWLSKSPHWY